MTYHLFFNQVITLEYIISLPYALVLYISCFVLVQEKVHQRMCSMITSIANPRYIFICVVFYHLLYVLTCCVLSFSVCSDLLAFLVTSMDSQPESIPYESGVPLADPRYHTKNSLICLISVDLPRELILLCLSSVPLA